MLGAYEFKNTTPDMKLLNWRQRCRGAMAHAPFLLPCRRGVYGPGNGTELPNIKRSFTLAFEGPAYTKWRALRDSEDSRYPTDRAAFSLRQPYSATENPIKSFNYAAEDVSHSHEHYFVGNTARCYHSNIADLRSRNTGGRPILSVAERRRSKKICRYIYMSQWGRSAPILTEVL